MKNNRLYVIAITFVATLGGLLFGYDTAVISGAEKSIQAYLIDSQGLSTLIHGLTISSALIGCIIGGLFSGIFASSFRQEKNITACSHFISPFSDGFRIS